MAKLQCSILEGRPQFKALMFGRRQPVYVAFDILFANGEDLRERPLRARKAVLKRLLGKRTDMVSIGRYS
jgi:ATP-dependent DNA ligase